MDNTPTNAHRRKLLAGVATAAAAVPLVAGLAACLWISAGFVSLAALIALFLPSRTAPATTT